MNFQQLRFVREAAQDQETAEPGHEQA